MTSNTIDNMENTNTQSNVLIVSPIFNIGDVVKMEKKTPFIPKRDRRISNIGVFGNKKQRDIYNFEHASLAK